MAATLVRDHATRSFRALGTRATVIVSRPESADLAESMLRSEIDALDAACSRFRPDSEIIRIAESDGRPVSVSRLCADALAVAIEVAELTGGAVDPTVGTSLVRLGYDRDFEAVAADGPALRSAAQPVPGWWCIELDRSASTVRVPAGVVLDLGSSAKAWAADRAATAIAEASGSGVLVNLGGDVAVAGDAPEGGWPVGIALRSATDPLASDCTVAIRAGGLASSGTAVRRWRRGGEQLHHVLDPWTGAPADSPFLLVSVAAPSCLEANAASTASFVWGSDALGRLRGLGHPARLVEACGRVHTLNGWPAGDPLHLSPHLRTEKGAAALTPAREVLSTTRKA